MHLRFLNSDKKDKSLIFSHLKRYKISDTKEVYQTDILDATSVNEKLQEAIEIIKNVALNDENVLDGFQVFIEKLIKI